MESNSVLESVTKSSTAKCWHENLVEKFKIFVQDLVTIKRGVYITPVFMVTKSCTKILNFSTRLSYQHFAVEDFVTLPMGKKSCR